MTAKWLNLKIKGKHLQLTENEQRDNCTQNVILLKLSVYNLTNFLNNNLNPWKKNDAK